MGATRDVALSEQPFRGISVNPASTGTTPINVVASDSGVVFVNKYASATTYNLPTVALAKGKMFIFFNQGAGGIVITGGTASSIVCKNNAAATSVTFATGGGMIGAGGMILCDGTKYFFFPFGDCTVS